MNLKEAARTLGVHYQTAYKWVRSGALTAVRVGSRYEVSQAAIDQFLATRRTLLDQADHVTDRPGRRRTDLEPEDVLEELEVMLGDPIVTVPAVERFVARRGAQVLGDICMIWIRRSDGSASDPVYEHLSAERAAFATAMTGMAGRLTTTGGIVNDVVLHGVSVRDEHVDQYRLRRAIRPELRQYMDRFPVHSILAAPVVVNGEVRGVIGFTREDASRPYTADDECFATRLGRRLGALVLTADETTAAWELRSRLADIVRDRLGHRRPGKPLERMEVQAMLFAPGSLGAEAPLPCFVVSPDGKLLGLNPAMARIAGLPADEIETFDLRATLDPRHLDEEDALFQRLASGELDYHDFHVTRVRADGTPVPVVLHRVAVREDDATLACVVGVARPVHSSPTISNLVGV